MKTKVEEKFSDYYEKWITQLEDYLHLLVKLSKEDAENHQKNSSEFESLVSKLTAHHKEYYQSKWTLAHEDVLPFFSPVWLSPFEIAYLWITGWKPSMLFRLLDSLRQTQLQSSQSQLGLSDDQWKKVEELKLKIKMEEQKVEREMERQQMVLADRRMVELARMTNRVKDGDSAATQVDGLVEAALKGLFGGLERSMKMGDCVRLMALKGILDVLNPRECLEFLAALTTVLIRLRKLGKTRTDNDMENENDNENCKSKTLQ